MPEASQELRFDQAALSLLAPTYRLASTSIIFRWHAETDYLRVHEWMDPPWSSSPDVLRQPLGIMRHCASQLKSSLTVAAQSCLDELISEANYRQDDMAEEWSMPARTEVLELWLHCPPDSEFVAAVSQKIISDSIVGASHWSYFVKKQKNLAGVLPQPLRAVFRLALLLARVPYPSWKDFHHIKGWLSSNPEHLIGRIGPRVQRQRAAIAKHTDALDDLPDFIAGRADPYTLACNLHDEIQSRFDTLAQRTADHSNRIAETTAEGGVLPTNGGYSTGTHDGVAISDTDSIADAKPFADMEIGKAKGLQPYVYKRVATGWNVKFGGAELIAIPDTVGSFYLHLLLQSPDHHFTATELSNQRTLFERVNPSPMVSDDEVGVGGALDDGQLMDDEGIACAMRVMNNLEIDLQAATKNHDSAKMNELRQKQRKIRKYVSAAWRPGGAHTVVNSLHGKAVGRVRKEISRTIDKITELYRDLGLHLEDSITKGPICSYRSQESIEWYC